MMKTTSSRKQASRWSSGILSKRNHQNSVTMNSIGMDSLDDETEEVVNDRRCELEH